MMKSKLLAYLERHSEEVQGIAWMLLACFLLSATATVVRHVSFSLPAMQIVFFRNLCALVFFLPWLIRLRFAPLKTTRLKMHGLRSLTGITGMVLWFYVLSNVELNLAITLSFTVPHITVLLAMLLLGEKMRGHRWWALVFGLVGVLVVLRPGFDAVHPAAYLMLVATCVWGFTNIIIKKLTSTEDPKVIVFYMTLLMTPLSAPLLFFFWQDLTWTLLGWLLLLGWLSNQAHFCLAKSYTHIDISAAQSFDFSRLVFGTLLGYVFFQEVLDAWTLLGAVVIFASSLYVARRESRVKGNV